MAARPKVLAAATRRDWSLLCNSIVSQLIYNVGAAWTCVRAQFIPHLESGSLLFIAAILIIARNYRESWMFWGGGLLVGYALITNTLNWWNYFKRTYQQSWYQSGWISPQELAICTGNAGVRMPLSEIVQKSEYPDQVLLTQRSGQSYCILRQMVDTDEQWQRLSALQLGSEASSTA